MVNSLWERFLEWLCSKVGHNIDEQKIRWYNDRLHTCCKRCGKNITKYHDDKGKRVYWK